MNFRDWWQWARGKNVGTKDLQFENFGSVADVVNGYPTWFGFDSYGALYRRQPAVRTVVDFLAKNIAQLNPKIYLRSSDRREWHDHPVAELLRQPNPSTTRYAHLRDTVADIAIYDRAYWRMVQERGLTRALVRIPPSRLHLEFNQETKRTTYRLNGNVISRDELVIFHGYHPDGEESGVSPLETLRRVLAEEWAAQIHREWFWRNAARQHGVIERPLEAPQWSKEGRERFRNHWQETMAGGLNSGKAAILEEGMKWNTASFSPKDSEYIESRKLTYIEVARVYAPALAGLLGEEGKTATESFHRHLYQDAMQPLLEMIEGEIDLQLLTRNEFNLGPAYCEFNLADKLKGSFEERNRAETTAVGVPYRTINEARTGQNLPRIEEPWADIPIRPLNVLYGGQPSTQIPTSDPGLQSSNLVTKLEAYFDEQEQVICSRLGPLKGQGEEAIVIAWDESRWNEQLAKLYPSRIDAPSIASQINNLLRQAVTAAFVDGGLKAVHNVFKEAKNNASQLQIPQPALTA